MKINIKHLKLINFKGIQHLDIDFQNTTEIHGANATGKTTVFDAFTWLLFGKDSQDRQNFEVKTLTPDGKPIHKLDHEVEGVIDIDGQELKLRRCLREKWTTRRGSSEPDFTGHETTFFVNDVPMQAGEYQTKIAEIIPENSFKLVTNPAYFNQQMKWQDRRDMLISMVGDLTHDQIAGDDIELKELVDMMLTQNKSDEDLKKEYAAKKKLIKKELDSIPGRIDEVSRNNGNGNGEVIDVDGLTKQLLSITEQLTSVKANYDKQKEAVKERKRKASLIESALIDRESEIKREYNKSAGSITDKVSGLRDEFSRINNKKDLLEKQVKEDEQSIVYLNTEIEKLRKKWHEVNNQAFKLNGDLKCPTCHQDLPNIEERKVELQQNFNTNKVDQLGQITSQGKTYNERLESIKKTVQKSAAEITSHKARMLEINGEIGVLEAEKTKHVPLVEIIAKDPKCCELEAQLKEVENNIVSIPDDKAGAELESERAEIIAALERSKEREAAAEAKMKRLDELQHLEKNLSEQLADMEQFEFIINRFQANRINMIESKVNGLFTLVTFRMFAEQINGGEKQTCETLINGVPYQDANHAAQINAGIDIINTFSDNLKLTAPIWVDNAEAVNVLTKTNSQIIKLLVTNDKKLLIK